MQKQANSVHGQNKKLITAESARRVFVARAVRRNGLQVSPQL